MTSPQDENAESGMEPEAEELRSLVALKRLQEKLRPYVGGDILVSDELIAERRAEALRE